MRPTMILSAVQDQTTQLMWGAAVRRGMRIKRLTRETMFEKEGEPYYYYGNTLDSGRFQIPVPTPFLDPNWLPNLPHSLTQRRIQLMQARKARQIADPRFIKCVETKWMPAAIRTGAEIPQEVHDEDQLLVSEQVRWLKEYRCFAQDDKITTMCQYRDGGMFSMDEVPPEKAEEIVKVALAARRTLPNRGVVIDVGELDTGKLAVIEANEIWASGIYLNDPDRVLDAVMAEQDWARSVRPPLIV